jgi:hypothetical protein
VLSFVSIDNTRRYKLFYSAKEYPEKQNHLIAFEKYMSHLLYKINVNQMSFSICEDDSITLSYFSSFDNSDDDSDSITFDFDKNVFKNALGELQRIGFCKISGKDCSLAISKMKDHGYSINLTNKSTGLSASFEDEYFDPVKLNFV